MVTHLVLNEAGLREALKDANARVAELEAALGEICEHDHCYVGTDADTANDAGLYCKMRRARDALAKGQA